MFRFALPIGILLSISCAEDKSYNHVELCTVDGANIYVQCADSRQKGLRLGYGKFPHLIRDGRMAAAEEFCKGKPREIKINIKNAHFRLKGKKTSKSFWLIYQDSIHSACSETKLFEHLNQANELNIETRPLTESAYPDTL